MWNDRYGKIEFAYGEQPNNFLKNNLLKFLQVLYYFQQRAKDETQFMRHTRLECYALIKVGKESAKLANKHDVAINYEVGESIGYQENQFDAIALIYAHFPADKKSSYHKILTTYLRPGIVILKLQ
jgi:hypothetical protein